MTSLIPYLSRLDSKSVLGLIGCLIEKKEKKGIGKKKKEKAERYHKENSKNE